MFRCSECGLEYKDKPDFCECGNDIFEEFYPTITETEPQKPSIELPKEDIVSWIIFGICIILSIIILLFFPKIEETQPTQVQPKQEKNVKIPDIDTFWQDSQPTQQENILDQIKDTIFKPKPEPVAVKPQPKQTAKPTAKPVSKPQAKPQQTKTQQTKPTATTKTQTKKVTTPTTGKPQSQSYNYEIVNYRTALRQRLFSNLDLYKIEGSGTCGIEFSIDENGKLINRNFTFQSDNKSVNDQVYIMLMRTARFNPPPSGYANKLIKMVFKLSTDSYEIRFAN